MLTVQEVMDELGYDYIDPMIERKIIRLINFADSHLQGSIGINYPKDDPEAKELALLIITDMFDKDDASAKVSANIEKIINSASLHLILKMRSDNNV